MPPKWWPPNLIPPKRIPPKCPNPPPLMPPPKCPPKRDCAALDHKQSAPRLIMIRSRLANLPGILSSTVTEAPRAHDRCNIYFEPSVRHPGRGSLPRMDMRFVVPISVLTPILGSKSPGGQWHSSRLCTRQSWPSLLVADVWDDERRCLARGVAF